MESTFPKGHDPKKDGRCAPHCSMDKTSSEFLVWGTAGAIEDDETRTIAVQHASYDAADRYILFELEVEKAFNTVYDEEGTPIRKR